MQKSALPKVSGGCSGTVDRCASTRTSPDTLPPCRLHTAPPVGATSSAEQEDHLRPPVSHQRPNTSGSRSRSETPRCGNWFLQRVAHLESEAQYPPSRPLCRSRRRPLARSHPLGSLTRELLPSQTGAAESLSRQIRRRAQASFSERPTQLPWRPEAPSPRSSLPGCGHSIDKPGWCT